MAFELFNLNEEREEREINRMFTELEKPAIRKVARERGIRVSIITMRDNRYKVSIKK